MSHTYLTIGTAGSKYEALNQVIANITCISETIYTFINSTMTEAFEKVVKLV